MKRTLIFAIALGAGCGGSAGSYDTMVVPGTDEPTRDLPGYEARLAELRAELDQAMPADSTEELAEPRGELPINPSSKCLVAADLRDRICDLSERICTIAGEEPGSTEVADKCESARAACDDARRRVASACGEL